MAQVGNIEGGNINPVVSDAEWNDFYNWLYKTYDPFKAAGIWTNIAGVFNMKGAGDKQLDWAMENPEFAYWYSSGKPVKTDTTKKVNIYADGSTKPVGQKTEPVTSLGQDGGLGTSDPEFYQWMVDEYGKDMADAVIAGKTQYTPDEIYDYWSNNVKTTTTPATSDTGTTAGGTTSDRFGLPEGYWVVSASVFTDGMNYYDYGAYLAGEAFNPLEEDYAKTLIAADQARQADSVSTIGTPKKVVIDGEEWWGYYDENGNPTGKWELVDDTNKDMTPYQKAQTDLARDQFEWNKQQAEVERLRAEEAKFTGPRDWIQRWGQQNPGTLPNAPGYLQQFTRPIAGIKPTPWGNTPNESQMTGWTGNEKGIMQNALGTNPTPNTAMGGIGALDASKFKLASGQALSGLAPSELQGVYGYVDWAAGRGSPYASGEDWAYRSQQLLPTNQPKRTVSWNPNVRS